jgi:hypothetical protein
MPPRYIAAPRLANFAHSAQSGDNRVMNVRFVLRGTLLVLVALLLALTAVLLFTEPGRQLLPSLPPAVLAVPTLTAPHGALPAASVGLVEWTRYGAGNYRPVGRGFLFRLPEGQIVGVTTAHSLSFNSQPPLRNIALAQGERSQPVVEFDVLRGEPGMARTGEDMTIDYVLLEVPSDHQIDPTLVLEPDPRSLPQAGERVALYSLIGDQPRVFQGAVLSAEPNAVWVMMDEAFDPSGLSGSPFLSQHTGKVIGMAIATTKRGGRVLLGLHPISSLVEKSVAAQTFLRIADYRR